MPFPALNAEMRSMQPGDKSWFRVDNAHVDSENATTDSTKVFIYDIIGDSWFGDATPASEFIKQISAIKTPNIELHLNSPGGDIFDGVAIYNALKQHSAKVTVIVDALAASAASFIAQSGDEIIMTEGAMMMIHDGRAGVYGPAADMRKTAGILDQLSNNVAAIYAARAGQTEQFWRDQMIEETWYNAAEAVDAGLADRKDGQTTEADATAQNRWLTFFNYAGRGAAPDPLVARQRIANILEDTVARPTNETGKAPDVPETEVNPSAPDANPDTDTTQGNQEDVDKEKGTNPGEVPDPPTGDSPQNRLPEQPQNAAGTVKFKVGDELFEMTTDEAARQLAVLTQFRKETADQNRRDYVAQLAADNKILAPQVKDMTDYALSLSEEGFAAWAKLYENGPALPMLSGSHAEGTSNHAGTQQTDEADRIEVLKGIVNQHRKAGMPEERIMEKKSYQDLMVLDPTFKLSDLT